MKITKKKKLIPFIQSILILVLIVFVMLMMAQIRNLQGTARVINYAGLVRGATQRTIKLEIAERPNDDLIAYLDEVLEDLKHGEGTYQLVKLNDHNYQQCLDAQISYWEQLKNEIYATRESGYEATNIVEMSETYFDLADETVTAAEVYSEQIAIRIRWIEYISAVDMFLLFLAILVQYLSWLKIARTNSALEKKAYLDVHTGLPNKSRCEELLRNTDPLPDSIGFIMFDLNNLKSVNDTLGHAAGDSLISAFARIVRNTVPEKDFVGRFGGDEFIAILYDTNLGAMKQVLKELEDEITAFNRNGKHLPISYAHGWTLSSEYHECTLRTLFDKADHNMYLDKQRMKAEIGK